MSRTILERVKISLKQYHIKSVTDDETGETTSEVVFDKEGDNPILEEFIQANTDELVCKIEPPDKKKDEVVERFSSCIVELVRYDYSKIGGDFQASHSENSITRSWNSKEEIYNFYGVNECRYVKFLQ